MPYYLNPGQKRNKKAPAEAGAYRAKLIVPILPYKVNEIMSAAKFSCIVFFSPEKNIKPRAYYYVNYLPTFLKFATRQGAWYVNVYDRRSRNYLRREYLTSLNEPKKTSP